MSDTEDVILAAIHDTPLALRALTLAAQIGDEDDNADTVLDLLHDAGMRVRAAHPVLLVSDGTLAGVLAGVVAGMRARRATETGREEPPSD